MMTSIFSKVIVSFYMVLTILIAFKCNVGECGFLLPEKVVLEIINKLNSKTNLNVHCKDKRHDLNLQTIQPNQSWSFKFLPNPVWDSTLYFCSFTWSQTLHRFDVYAESRDQKECTKCSWEISESGPCRVTSQDRNCFKWKD
ncbi:hypothetical protein HN51_008362 [Arachis hypogaea]